MNFFNICMNLSYQTKQVHSRVEKQRILQEHCGRVEVRGDARHIISHSRHVILTYLNFPRGTFTGAVIG